jgi:hypothetical protein
MWKCEKHLIKSALTTKQGGCEGSRVDPKHQRLGSEQQTQLPQVIGSYRILEHHISLGIKETHGQVLDAASRTG